MMRPFTLLTLAILVAGCDSKKPEPETIVYRPEPTVDSFIQTVLSTEGKFADMTLAEILKASTGNEILPFDLADPVSVELHDAIADALDWALATFSEDSSVTNSEKRINEVSSYFEDALRRKINAVPGISCDYPKTAAGKVQRSGYPDLRIVHEATGRVAYLDPKLVETGSLKSSLRTFYFTPKGETNKVLEDAHHLLVGIEHNGDTGNWKFLEWHLVDLTEFKVRLKAEFQASNRDLYQEDLIVSGRKRSTSTEKSDNEKEEEGK